MSRILFEFFDGVQFVGDASFALTVDVNSQASQRFIHATTFAMVGAFEASAALRFVNAADFAIGDLGLLANGSETFPGASVYRVSLAHDGDGQELFHSLGALALRLRIDAIIIASEPTGVAIIDAYGASSIYVAISPTITTMIAVHQAATTRIASELTRWAIVDVTLEHATTIATATAQATTIEVERKDGIMSRTVGDAETIVFSFRVFDAVSEQRVFTDPDRVLFHVVRPDGTSYVLEYEVDPGTEINRIALGRYWAKIPFPIASLGGKPYRFLIQGTSPAEGTEPGEIMVEEFESPFPTFTP